MPQLLASESSRQESRHLPAGHRAVGAIVAAAVHSDARSGVLRLAADVAAIDERCARGIHFGHAGVNTAVEGQVGLDGDGEARFTRSRRPSDVSMALATLLAVTALAATALMAYRYLARSQESHTLPISSIAVLPLKNLSNDPAQEYDSDGMTESLITALSKIERMKVISRSSVFRFKGQEVDPREVGRQLGVAALLEGSWSRTITG